MELKARGLRYETRVTTPVRYKGLEFEFAYESDIVVEDLIVLELKCVTRISPAHRGQCLTYMRFLECPVGFVINFAAAKIMGDGSSRLVLSQFLPPGSEIDAEQRG